ncbi:MAG: cytochrome c [Paracoccaceae bacterium]
MNLITKTLAIGLLLVGGVAYAEGDATDANAIARETLMKTVGMNTKVLGDMAGDKAAFDAAAATAAKAAIAEAAGKIAATFETQGGADPTSEVKPDIWTNWADFLTKADGLATAAAAVDVASLEGVKAGMAGLGGACKACHTTYRVQQ